MKRIFTVTWVYLESQRRLRVRADGGYVREGESLTFLDESLAWVCALRADLVTGLVEELGTDGDVAGLDSNPSSQS